MIRRPPSTTLFPTRRSSDLPAGGAAPRATRSSRSRRAFRRRRRRTGRDVRAGRSGTAGGPRHAGSREPRSEEHTSELQSQFHLVCRLLLEKKKKNSKSTVSG